MCYVFTAEQAAPKRRAVVRSTGKGPGSSEMFNLRKRKLQSSQINKNEDLPVPPPKIEMRTAC